MYLDVIMYWKRIKDTKALAELHPLLYYFSLWTRRSGLGAFLNGNTLLNLMMVAWSSFPSPFKVLSFQYPQFRNQKHSISCVLHENKLKNNLINYYQLVPFFFLLFTLDPNLALHLRLGIILTDLQMLDLFGELKDVGYRVLIAR